MSQDRNAVTASRPGLISRRTVLVQGAAALAAPYILSTKARASDPLVLVFAGGSTQVALEEAIIKPFTAETGIPVTIVNTIDMAKLKIQVQSKSVEWDLFDYVGPALMQAGAEGLLEEIDPDVFKGTKMFDNPSPYMVGYGFYVGGICFDPKRNPNAPRNYPEFWDVEKFPGRRGLRLRASETLECALLADGVPPKEIYPMDVDRAFRSLAKIKPHIRKWVEQTQQTVDLVKTGELDYSYTYLNRVKAIQDAGISMDFSQDQLVVYGSYYCVPKGAPHKDAAMKYLSFVLQNPERLADFCRRVSVVPGNLNANAYLDDAAKKLLPDLNNPAYAVLNNAWWGENFAAIEPRFKEFILS
ncbi:ABC transporter substrate-binding protein [Agaricicola taiwanensis]|uniref:ABC transporter substrate-binding protein n=1 Tax=Agaricicola taiwanensis TaxID=591372 RepID=A0A8J2YKD3_9RHOB|nr:ABC transporter substrate-binding protein [Agaricicola taiwanensis]GGE49643.1 ABC transporter substrate-binding protein [Agaricicola taiwanensis]